MRFPLLRLPRSRAVRGTIAAACALPVVLSILACPGPGPQDAGGPDLFKLAVNGAPGGALLSAFAFDTGGLNTSAYLAGGYVSVDHAMVTDGKVGRLVFYDGAGHFNTVCTTDEVLWWVTGYHDPAAGDDRTPPTWVIYAVGEGGRVIRYKNNTCETLPVDLTYPEGLPTFWGAAAAAPDDLWLVGGSALPNGPKGVLVHYDGAHFTQEQNMPAAARTVNLYKIDLTRDFTYGAAGAPVYGYVVGEGATVLRRDFASDAASPAWAAVDVAGVRAQDNRLFTVSCSPNSADSCVAVGGAGAGLMISNEGGAGWTNVESVGSQTISDLPGINGVWTDGSNHFFVGVQGLTMHATGTTSYAQSYVPAQALTSATLHGVHGAGSRVIAVGGELGVTDTTQKAVILVRGDDATTYTFDGVQYMAQGDLRACLGTCGGQ